MPNLTVKSPTAKTYRTAKVVEEKESTDSLDYSLSFEKDESRAKAKETVVMHRKSTLP